MKERCPHFSWLKEILLVVNHYFGGHWLWSAAALVVFWLCNAKLLRFLQMNRDCTLLGGGERGKVIKAADFMA